MKALTHETPSASTVEYYNQHAAEYCSLTLGIDLSDIYGRFLTTISPSAYILDAGCGSGRDTKAFLDRGYKVTAIDASSELARLAAQYSNHTCEVMRFQEMNFKEEFDAIWACASLLHVPGKEIEDVLFRFMRALKPMGILYVSLKEGEGERISEDGRFFRNYTRRSFEQILKLFPALEEIDFWKTDDLLNDPQRQPWLGFLLRRTR
jgi:2-polyprenyl-3-methyl-5-hydroxy-6-metoxy-1,4-benzoquinol methylase